MSHPFHITMLRSLLPGAVGAFAMLSPCLGPPAMAQPMTRPHSEMIPRMVAPDARIPVRLESVDMRAEVIGHAVQTRVELLFRNPNTRQLEGELQFPLREGQVITGFALDINGELRPAVPVDKAKGQQVFEDVIRTRIDPALLEVTQGRNYKLRVYPLPPQGTRRVVLQIAQTLEASGRGTGGQLTLPLAFADRLSRLDFVLRVADTSAASIGASAPGVPPQAFVRSQHGRWGHLSLHRTDLAGASALDITLPERRQPLAATQTVAGQTYFYAEVPVPPRVAPRPAPRRIALLWDASGSGAQRDHLREFALLDAYFGALSEVEVSLRVGRDVAEATQRFSVRNGRWDDLRRALDGLAYDGATNLPALLAPDGHDVALLFSDGLSNWNLEKITPGSIPLYALSTGTRLDSARLRALAEQSGGKWLDLSTVSTADAARALKTHQARLVGLSSNSARQMASASPYPANGRLALAGILGASKAAVELVFELPDGRLERQQIKVDADDAGPATPGQIGSGQVAQRWASLRVEALEADFDSNRGEIRRLGKSFGLVTPETSLIVLDAVADYVRHEIEPPPSLRAEYESRLARQVHQSTVTKRGHLDHVASRFAQQVAWWERRFPKTKPPRPQEQDEPAAAEAGAVGNLSQDEPPLARRLAPPGPAMAAPLAERARGMTGALPKQDASDAGPTAAQATIHLTPWEPDSAYARRLRQSPPETVYQRYLDERPDFVDSTAFFLDAADVLFAKGRPELALRVLSNLAEMDLENRHILRVLGYRLLQASEARLAIPVFKTVLRLSPNEPQSYRDLALAQAEAEQWQEAADQLWQVVSRPWDGRFPDIDMTALAELNAVIDRAARDGKPVQTGGFDQRLLRNLPLDLRITLAWDADNTDIDLWVTDPNGEKTFYGNRLSHQGGRISQDVTGGYGPEEFALRNAKPGRYTVQAQFYGHRQQVVAPATTLMLRLTTGFGRAGQKDQLVTMRLAGQSDIVTVGSFDVVP